MFPRPPRTDTRLTRHTVGTQTDAHQMIAYAVTAPNLVLSSRSARADRKKSHQQATSSLLLCKALPRPTRRLAHCAAGHVDVKTVPVSAARIGWSTGTDHSPAAHYRATTDGHKASRNHGITATAWASRLARCLSTHPLQILILAQYQLEENHPSA